MFKPRIYSEDGPILSPDGNRLYFNSDESSVKQIYVMEVMEGPCLLAQLQPAPEYSSKYSGGHGSS